MRSAAILICLITLVTAGCVNKGGSGGSEDNKVYAVVDGKEIKGKEVLERVKGEMSELNRQMYDLKRRATEQIVQDRILEGEAKRQGTTVDQLFKQFDALREKDVADADIDAFLKKRNIDRKKLKKAELKSVPNIIKMQRVYEARQKYVNELRQKANVKIKLTRPMEKPIDVAVGTNPPRGPASAKVAIVEFSDFECPFCSRGRDRLEEVRAKYGDKVKIYYRHFPLESIHPNAFKSAEGTSCARDQGKFWEYHDELFRNQRDLKEKSLVKHAKTIGLDEAKFAECLKSGKYAEEVRADMKDAQKYGVNSTPTFYINGHILRGAVPLDQFSDLIELELGK